MSITEKAKKLITDSTGILTDNVITLGNQYGYIAYTSNTSAAWRESIVGISKGLNTLLSNDKVHTIDPNIRMELNDWDEEITVKLSAATTLNEWRRKQLEHEYEMECGTLEVPTTKAMLFYVLRQYGFNPYDRDDDGMMRNVSSFQLEVLNSKEVEECLRRRS